MPKNDFSKKMQLNSEAAIKVLLYLTALTPLVLLANFSFSYVTVKTVFFRVLIEISAILFLWLLLKNKIGLTNFKKNYFFWLWLGLLVVESVAALAGQSYLTSFFSNLERMWGIFTVAHLFLFYCLIRIFFGEKEWRNFFNISFAVSMLVSIYGIVQRFPNTFGIYVFEAGIQRITSTLGNPTYVAIYLLFNIVFALIFFFKEQRRSFKIFYLAAITLDLFAFALTDIRGAYLGIILGAGVALFLYLFLGKNKKYKIAFISLLAVGILIAGFIFLNPQNKFISRVPILNRLSTISLTSTTVKTRLMSWNAAWQGFKQYPVLGVGMENFNIVFNKYFQASYYNLAPTETYFDRAHNQYLNLLAESGPAALLIYLGMFYLIGYYLIKNYRTEKIPLTEFLILLAIFVAYGVHIFFVFDDINSFLFFALLVAFIEFHYRSDVPAPDNGAAKLNLFTKILVALGILILIFSIYSFNFKTLKAAGLSAQGYMVSNFEDKVKYFNESIDTNIIPAENLIFNDVDFLTSLSDQLSELSSDQRRVKLFDSAIQKVKAALHNEITKKPANAFLYLKDGQLNNLAYLFYNDKSYLESAISDLKKGIELSPQRLQLYYVLGESYVIGERDQEAKDILEKALQLNPDFAASYYYLGRAYLVSGDIDRAYDYIINQAIKDRNYIPENTQILLALSQPFVKNQNYQKVVVIYEEILTIDTKNAQVAAGLAAAYVQLDQFDKAIEAAQRAAALDPSFASDAELFIKMIKSGQIQELKEMTR